MKKYFLILLCLFILPVLAMQVSAEENSAAEATVKKEKSWWQLRNEKQDIFYPHKAHMEVMADEGDACMLCHPFSKNTVEDKKVLARITQINNESLQAICHNCHVEKMKAPSACRLCHLKPETIWPQNHNYDYKNHHAQDARLDQTDCNTCHKKTAFCSDCHFKRNFNRSDVHRLGYKAMHGLDARMAPAQCGSCHQINYCTDCHRRDR